MFWLVINNNFKKWNTIINKRKKKGKRKKEEAERRIGKDRGWIGGTDWGREYLFYEFENTQLIILLEMVERKFGYHDWCYRYYLDHCYCYHLITLHKQHGFLY
jgi:hypothetical protein